MSEKDVTRFLQILGLSKREIQVYMFLAKSGVQSASFVAKRLKMERVQAEQSLKEGAGEKSHNGQRGKDTLQANSGNEDLRSAQGLSGDD